MQERKKRREKEPGRYQTILKWISKGGATAVNPHPYLEAYLAAPGAALSFLPKFQSQGQRWLQAHDKDHGVVLPVSLHAISRISPEEIWRTSWMTCSF